MKKLIEKLKKVSVYVWVIVGALLVALILFLIGGAMAGWDIIGWLKSPLAVVCYLFLGMALLTVLYKVLKERIYK